MYKYVNIIDMSIDIKSSEEIHKVSVSSSTHLTGEDIMEGYVMLGSSKYNIFLEPNDKRIIVKKLTDEFVTKSGLYMPRNETPNEGVIVETFPNYVDDKGNTVFSKYQVGERIIVKEFAGDQIKANKYKGCFIINENDIQCVYKLRLEK